MRLVKWYFELYVCITPKTPLPILIRMNTIFLQYFSMTLLSTRNRISTWCCTYADEDSTICQQLNESNLLINFHNKRYILRLTEGNIKLPTCIQKLCAYFSQHTAAVPIAIQWMSRFWKINHSYYTWNKRSNHNFWKYVVS